MHAISIYHGNRPTHTNTRTHRQDRLKYTAPQLACSVIVAKKQLACYFSGHDAAMHIRAKFGDDGQRLQIDALPADC